jgi:cytochrome P450
MIVFAGTDTTSSAMNRMFHLLATYPEVQEKLRAEILTASEQLNYDALVSLPYLDGVVREVLRLWVQFDVPTTILTLISSAAILQLPRWRFASMW